jgi:hypothetical protein
MSANRFSIEGDRIDSLSEFLRAEVDDCFGGILYYPREFTGSEDKPLVFRGKRFHEVSFKDTIIKNIRFIECEFKNCLIMGASAVDCEFIDCIFLGTNTSKMKFTNCLIDPLSFEQNFDLKNDANLAIDLYHSLYRNSAETHQPKYSLSSLYRMNKAESKNLDSKFTRGRIEKKQYYIEKSKHIIHDFASGYGLKLSNVARLLVIVIGIFSVLNYLFSSCIFTEGVGVSTFLDSIYFTCVTITTLGYGDMTPDTQFGRIFITFQTLAGFGVISLFLAGVASRTLRSN